jgi:type I restriction enzyme, S subunit
LREGDLLLSIRGTAGTVARVPRELDGANITQDTARIRVRHDVNRRFIENVLRASHAQAFIRFHTVGQAVKGINIRDVRRIPVALPPLGEQDEIEELLERLDSGVHQVVALLNAKRRFKRGLAQQLLTGERRFEELGKQPWRTTTLAEWFEEFTLRNTGGEDLPILSCTKRGIVLQRDRFAKRLASASIERYKVVRRGDLVYDPMLLWDGSMGMVHVVDRGVVSPAYATFRWIGPDHDRAFVHELLASPPVRHQYRVISQGTNQRRRKALSEDFLSIQVSAPSNADERRAIGDIGHLLDAELGLLILLREALDQQRRGVAELLLTGKIRVPV